MLVTSTGMRPIEALSIPVKDLDLKSNPSRLFVRGEYTKTRSDRTIFLTQELDNQLSSWLAYIADDEFVIQKTAKLLLNIELLL